MVRHIRIPDIKDTFNMAIYHGTGHTITCTRDYVMVRLTRLPGFILWYIIVRHTRLPRVNSW